MTDFQETGAVRPDREAGIEPGRARTAAQGHIDVPVTPTTDEEIAKLPVLDLGEFLSDCGVSPCFVNCGEPACQKLGCVRVYNARHREAT